MDKLTNSFLIFDMMNHYLLFNIQASGFNGSLRNLWVNWSLYEGSSSYISNLLKSSANKIDVYVWANFWPGQFLSPILNGI